MTPADIDTEVIDNWLERGERQMIADELGVSVMTVRNVLKKRQKNLRVLERGYQIAVEKMRKWIAMQEQTNILKQKIESL
jgi:methylphosphotriester-DNA--protein-cysteine methyltransferase